MPVRDRRNEEWNEPWDDDDAEDDFGADVFDDGELDEDTDEEPTISCPYCRREIHEDAQRCPHCERYLSDEDATPERKPWWIIGGALACFYIFYRWILG